MSYLINPYIFGVAEPFVNYYSLSFTGTAVSADINILRMDNKANSVDTALRDATPNISVSTWFKSSDSTYPKVIFSKINTASNNDVNIQIRCETTGTITVYCTRNGTSSSVDIQTTATYNDGNWHHLVFVYDYSQTVNTNIVKMYIDGAYISSYTTFTVSTTFKYFQNQATEGNRAYVTQGCRWDATTKSLPFVGNIADTSFWDKSLTAPEVTEIYNSGVTYDLSLMTDYDTNCLGWWRMGNYASDNWNGTAWDIINVKGDADLDFVSEDLVESSRVADVPT